MGILSADWGLIRPALLVALLFGVFVPAVTAARYDLPQQEVSGIVEDPSGHPVAGARVELLANNRLVRSTFADPNGRFTLSIPAGLNRVQIRAERMGFAAAHVVIDLDAPPAFPIIIRLEPDPLPLPGFRIEGNPEVCPGRSQAEGLRMWGHMAAKHPDGLDTLGAATYTLVRVDTLVDPGTASAAVPGPQLDNSELHADGQRGFSGRLRLAWERRLNRDGYAFPIRRTDADGSYSTWSYAPLEADFASHFATSLFTDRHRLRAPAPSDEGGWILSFCPASEERPGLEGHLELSADTLLIRVEWRFRTPDPDEQAGGWARFPAAVDPSDPPRLLPLESMTWRRLRDGRVQRRAQWYEAWVVTPGDSVPFLPDRTPASALIPPQ